MVQPSISAFASSVVPDRRGVAPASRSLQARDFRALVEIANFVTVRREIGPARSNLLASDLANHIAASFPDVTARAVGRAQFELSYRGDAIDDLYALLTAISILFEQPVVIGGEPIKVDLLIGAAAASPNGGEDLRLIEEAESALEAARADHRPVVRDLDAVTAAFDRHTLKRELPVAIAEGQMFLQYQPKLHVRRQEITSCEALVRWQHPERGLIMPGDFITAVEEAREIGALTLWTLDQVIADQRQLEADGQPLTVFVNISGQLLSDPRFVAQACEKVRDSGAKIGFEITETAVIRDPHSAIAHLKAVANVGIPIAIDDYGAGLSSLAYLKQLPARELKIDKMFVLQLTSSNRDPLIVRSTIDLAHALEMEVTAEGVETQAAMALLSVMGCDMVQGYLLSRPLSIESFREYLAAERDRVPQAIKPDTFDATANFWKRA